MTAPTYSDANRAQRRMMQLHRLAVASALVAMLAITATIVARVTPTNERTSMASASELTQSHEPAPVFMEMRGKPY
jgi:nucleoside recognition membrane protein YjiH